MSVKTPALSHAGSHNVYCELPFHTSERQYTTLKASTKKFISLGDLHYIAIVSLKEIFAAVNKRGMRFLTSNCQYFLQLQNLLTFSCNKRLTFNGRLTEKCPIKTFTIPHGLYNVYCEVPLLHLDIRQTGFPSFTWKQLMWGQFTLAFIFKEL